MSAIAREGEPENALRSKVRQLFPLRAIDGLRPEVRNTVARDNVNDRAAVCVPGQVCPGLSCQWKCLDWLSTLRPKNGKFGGGILILKIGTSNLFSIG